MPNLAIKELSSNNYKNLSSESKVVFNDLNILIGPNGSGKSNLLGLLRFLKEAIIEGIDETGGIARFDKAILNLGGDRILDASLKPEANVEVTYHFPDQENAQDINLVIEFRIQGKNKKIIINKELLFQKKQSDEGEPFYFYKSHDRYSGKGVVSIKGNGSSTFQTISDIPVDELTIVSIPRLLENSDISPETAPVFQIRRNIIGSVSLWRFYNANEMNLKEIRHATPKIGPGDIYLSPSGENLPLVIDNLCEANIDYEESLNEAMKAVLPWTRKIRSARARLSLGIEWHFEMPDGRREQFDLSDMSDGTVRMLCWATILLSPELPRLLVIEEPEIGIHVAWLGILAGWIKTAAQKTQIILSTHSPDLLDFFTEELDKVFILEQSTQIKERFCVKKLDPQLLSGRLDEGWQLGDLYRTGDPAIGGWPW